MFGVFQNIDPPPPHLLASVYPRLQCGGRTHLLGGKWVGGSIFWKTPDTASTVLYIRKYFLVGGIDKGRDLCECQSLVLYKSHQRQWNSQQGPPLSGLSGAPTEENTAKTLVPTLGDFSVMKVEPYFSVAYTPNNNNKIREHFLEGIRCKDIYKGSYRLTAGHANLQKNRCSFFVTNNKEKTSFFQM